MLLTGYQAARCRDSTGHLWILSSTRVFTYGQMMLSTDNPRMDALPPWIDREAWDGFVEMRKAMKRIPFTPRAAKLILKELYTLKAAGHDPNVCLDQSTVNGWRDVFPPRHKDIPRVNQADDALLKIKEDEKKSAPMPDKVRSMLVNVVKRMP